MPSDIATWNTKDWLEASAWVVAILGGIAGAFIYLGKARAAAIEEDRKVLAREWTNEGDVTGKDTRFVRLRLEDLQGDLIGTLEAPSVGPPLEVHADVGWRSTTLSISQLRGNSIEPVATIEVRVTGNKNRLSWVVTSLARPSYLPPRTVLWPAGPATTR
jgi:hypothetical protein